MRVINASKKAAAVALIALFILSCVHRAHAGHHCHRSSAAKTNVPRRSLKATLYLDADAAQDRATLRANGVDQRISFRFGDARRAELAFAPGAADAGNLVFGDIDRDGDVDLIWLSNSGRDALVLLNDGEGNFAAAGDNSVYASELDDLFNSYDPFSPTRIKRGRKSLSLTSASFHEPGLALFGGFQTAIVRAARVSNREPLKFQSLFVGYLCKRGPPAALS